MQGAIVLVMWSYSVQTLLREAMCIFSPFSDTDGLLIRGDYVVHGAGVTICKAVLYLHRGQERYPAIMRRHGFQRRVIQFRIPLDAPLVGSVGPKRAWEQ